MRHFPDTGRRAIEVRVIEDGVVVGHGAELSGGLLLRGRGPRARQQRERHDKKGLPRVPFKLRSRVGAWDKKENDLQKLKKKKITGIALATLQGTGLKSRLPWIAGRKGESHCLELRLVAA